MQIFSYEKNHTFSKCFNAMLITIIRHNQRFVCAEVDRQTRHPVTGCVYVRSSPSLLACMRLFMMRFSGHFPGGFLSGWYVFSRLVYVPSVVLSDIRLSASVLHRKGDFLFTIYIFNFDGS